MEKEKRIKQFATQRAVYLILVLPFLLVPFVMLMVEQQSRGAASATEFDVMTPEEMYPPWIDEKSGALNRGVEFTVPEVENMPDFHGNPFEARLVIFAGGNYFFAMNRLVQAFQEQYPALKGKVFYETLPPGIIERQLKQGNAITVGNLTLAVQPDVVQAGPQRLRDLVKAGILREPVAPFIRNTLAIMVPKENRKGIASLKDLARPGVRVALPNPETEGVARTIMDALRAAGGDDLVHEVYEEKVKRGEAIITDIHHRQTPLWIMQGKVDAGPVWISEAIFQESIGMPITHTAIEEEYNQEGLQAAAVARDARNPGAARAWIDFLRSPEAARILALYGMEQVTAEERAAGK
ncbi:MAG: substrate-binding domain-containing protein [Nitrospirota bacterium]